MRKVGNLVLRTNTIVLCLISALILSFPCLSWAWSAKVVEVADGDSITVLRNYNQVKIRLYGIDCPEPGQAFGKKAKQFTSDMIFRKEVSVKPMTKDRYGLEVSLVFEGKTLINEELVKQGLAWVYWEHCHHPICESWKNYQLRARFDELGLWADPNPVPPWAFRRKKRSQ